MTIAQRERILLITRNFPPLTGGMERLNYHIYLEIEKEFEVCVAGSDGCQNYLAPHTAFSLFPHKPVGLFLVKSLIATYRFAVKEKPDLIIAGSGVTALAALIAGRRVGAKVMVFLHGLDILYPHPIYQLLFLPAIRACDGVWVNSSHTAHLAQQKKIAVDKINILHPGVSLLNGDELIADPASFKKSFAISDNRILLLSVGRLMERKGLPEFIRYCLPKIASEFPDILLIIIGNEATDALSKQSNITAKIKQAAIDANVESHVLLLGQVSENDLTQAYLCSELLIFPVLDLPGDVEGFGMVAVEAAAHGLPTVAFAVGGVIDAVGHGKSGWLVSAADYKALSKAIISFLSKSTTKKNTPSKLSCQNFAEKFSWDKFGERLNNIIQHQLKIK
jgi:phosphatidyl-myo-inositol dimannoside synthase